MPSSDNISLLELLITRLERISVDSYWAHRASGLRGSLLNIMELMESGYPVDESTLKELTEKGFQVLNSAVRGKK
jgi:hypothetical protein